MPAMLPPVPRARRKRQKTTSTFPVPAAGARSKIPTFLRVRRKHGAVGALGNQGNRGLWDAKLHGLQWLHAEAQGCPTCRSDDQAKTATLRAPFAAAARANCETVEGFNPQRQRRQQKNCPCR